MAVNMNDYKPRISSLKISNAMKGLNAFQKAGLLLTAPEVLGIAGAVATVGARSYLTYDLIKNGTSNFWKYSFGVSDPLNITYVKPKISKTPTIPIPTIADPIEKAIEGINKNTVSYNSMIEKFQKDALKAEEDSISSNTALGNSFIGSPLLQNQIYLKDSLDSISSRLMEQTSAMASILQVFDSQMTLLNTSLLTIAKNVQVSTQINKIVGEKDDYGDTDFFYSFSPTSIYWHDVDVATQAQHMEEHGSLEFLFVLPSTTYASSEINLIDSMQGVSSKAEIRKEVEAFRVSHVDSSIRARLGVVLVASQQSTAENTKAQTDYYKASTATIPNIEALARENIDAVKSVALATLNAPTLSSTVEAHIATMAEYATSAKVVSDHAQTEREIRDLDGDVVASMSPMALEASKNVALARGETDTNKIGGDLVGYALELLGDEAQNLLKMFSYFPITASTSNLGENMDSEYESLLNTWKGNNA